MHTHGVGRHCCRYIIAVVVVTAVVVDSAVVVFGVVVAIGVDVVNAVVCCHWRSRFH